MAKPEMWRHYGQPVGRVSAARSPVATQTVVVNRRRSCHLSPVGTTASRTTPSPSRGALRRRATQSRDGHPKSLLSSRVHTQHRTGSASWRSSIDGSVLTAAGPTSPDCLRPVAAGSEATSSTDSRASSEPSSRVRCVPPGSGRAVSGATCAAFPSTYPCPAFCAAGQVHLAEPESPFDYGGRDLFPTRF
jgi:hypothetical protein